VPNAHATDERAGPGRCTRLDGEVGLGRTVRRTPWHRDGMKIEVDGRPAARVLLLLTESEARELRDGLDDLLGHLGSSDWHAHVSSADFSTEITVASEVSA